MKHITGLNIYSGATAERNSTNFPKRANGLTYLDIEADTLYVHVDGDWHGLGGGGSSDHAALSNLSWVASGHTGTANNLPYFNGSNVAAVSPVTAAGLAILDDADAAAQRTTLGLVAGGAGDIWVEKAGDTMTGNLSTSGSFVANNAIVGYGYAETPDLRLRQNGPVLSTMSMSSYIGAATGRNLIYIDAGRGGSGGSGTALQSDDEITTVDFRGFSTSLGNAARIGLYANETFSGSTRSTRMVFSNVPNGSTTLQEKLRFADNAVVINEGGADVDLRVEGDTDANLLFVDGSTDQVGFGTNAPSAKAEVVSSTTSTTPAKGFQVNNTFSPSSAPGSVFPTSLQLNAYYDSANNSGGFQLAQFLNVRNVGNGTIDTRCLDIAYQNNGTGTVGNVFVQRLRAPVINGGGAITTMYGLYVEDQNLAGTNYAIYTNAGTVRFGGGVVGASPTGGDKGAGTINISAEYYRGGTQVVSSRRTGWAAATGTATRTTFATGTVTTAQLAERVKALIDDLIAHGLIGA